MRSTLLILLALALVLVAFAPVASADVNITLFQDSGCKQNITAPTEIPCTTSTACIGQPGQSGSGIFYCANNNGYDNVTIQAWQSASDCSGTADVSILAYAKDNTCASATITSGGQTVSVPAVMTVSASSEDGEQAAAMDVAELMGAVKRAAQSAARQSAKGLERLFARKRLGAQ